MYSTSLHFAGFPPEFSLLPGKVEDWFDIPQCPNHVVFQLHSPGRGSTVWLPPSNTNGRASGGRVRTTRERKKTSRERRNVHVEDTPRAQERKEKKGPVEPEKEEEDKLEGFFCHIYEFHNPLPNATVFNCRHVMLSILFLLSSRLLILFPFLLRLLLLVLFLRPNTLLSRLRISLFRLLLSLFLHLPLVLVQSRYVLWLAKDDPRPPILGPRHNS